MATHLITGGAGFIGSHLADYLLQRGENVVVIDNLSTGSYRNIEHLEGRSGFRCYVEDIRHESLLDELIRQSDRVYHLAASVGVRLIIEKPTESLINNIVGTEKVLRSASRYRKPVLITSTSEVYGKSQKDKFSEGDDRIMGSTDKSRWGYANSKATDEFLAMAYFEETRLPVVIVRLFNTVGPRQTGRYGMVIPNFVSQALSGLPLTVHGDGQQTRCFGHVLDIVPALTELLTRPVAFGKVFNLGSNREVSIQQLAELVLKKTKSQSEIRYIPYHEAYPPGFEDMQRRIPDISRIGSLIGFQPSKSLEDIIDDVIVDQSARLREAAANAVHDTAMVAAPANGTSAHAVQNPAPGNGNSTAVKAASLR